MLFCILLCLWEFDCSLCNICICVWSLFAQLFETATFLYFCVFYRQQFRDSLTWTRMQCPFLASQIGCCSLTHFCCDHYSGIYVIELGWTKVSSSIFPQFILRCGHKIEQTWNLLHVSSVFPFNQATNDLENYDKERHDEFKRYEMMKEHNRREHLKTLDNEERRKEEEHYEDMKKKHADHPKINHPVRGKPLRWWVFRTFKEPLIVAPVFAGEPESAQRGLGGSWWPGPQRLRPQDLLQIAR